MYFYAENSLPQGVSALIKVNCKLNASRQHRVSGKKTSMRLGCDSRSYILRRHRGCSPPAA